jgi:hypothetical protein
MDHPEQHESELAKAFTDRTVFSASDDDLQRYLEGLCSVPTDKEGATDHKLIQAIALMHLLLANSIRRMNRRNIWFAITVGAVAFVSISVSIIQIWAESPSKMTKALNEFSAATSEATSVTTSALSIVQAVDQDEAILRASGGNRLRESDFPTFFQPDDLIQRQLILQSLSTYVAALAALSSADTSNDIRKNADSLKKTIDVAVTRLNQLDKQSTVQIPADLASDLVSLGSNIVMVYTRGGRDKAVRKALEDNDNRVTRICGQLANEFEPHGIIYDQLKNAYQVQEEVASMRFEELVSQNPKPMPKDVEPYVRTFLSLKTKKEYLLALLRSVGLSYHRLGQAHTALKLQSENGVPAEVQLKALSSEIDNLKFLSSQVSK